MEEVVRIRVLGPLEVWQGEARRPVGAAKVRGLLALLVLRANRVAERDWLIDRLWDGDPPPAARTTLQSNVYRLRKLLERSDGQVLLRTHEAGYELDVPDEAVDLLLFGRIVDDAKAGLAAGETDAAIGGLRRGLDLWRGEAFADIELTEVRARADEWGERRWDVTEQYFSAVLAAGRHRTVIGELETYVNGQPLRERGWELLMTALYRCGRQADALQAYRRAYDLMTDQLGVEPTPGLRALHQRILNADPALDSPAPAPTGQAAPRVVPRQLPTPIPNLAGRSEALACLDAMPGRTAIAVITGGAGVGKTALAVRWAQHAAARFPGGQLYVDLRGFDPGGTRLEAASALPTLLDGLGVPPERIPIDPQARTALLRSLLADRRVLLVLDNARDADHVRPLLPGVGPSLVVVTSRRRLSGLTATHGAQTVQLEVLTPAAARELLESRLGSGRLDADPGAVTTLITRCAHLPLALAIVAARAAGRPTWPLRSFAAELDEAHRALAVLRGDDTTSDLTAVLSWSYRALQPDAARLFRLLGLHPGPDLTVAAAAALAGTDIERTRRLLDDLVDDNLLAENGPGRCTFHDLLRVYASGLADTEETDASRRAAERRLVEHYVHTAYAASRHLDPLSEPIEAGTLNTLGTSARGEAVESYADALAWYRAEQQTLIPLARTANRLRLDEHTIRLVRAIAGYVARNSNTDRLAIWQLAAEAAERLGDRREAAIAYGGLARAHSGTGDHREAHAYVERGLAICRTLGDPELLARAHFNAAGLLADQEHWAGSLAHMRQSLTNYRKCGHTVGEASALNGMGWAQAHLDDHRAALDNCREALELFRRAGDRAGEAAAWDSLGFAHHGLGEYDRAIECYRNAIPLWTEVGESVGAGETYANLGHAHRAAGDRDAALDAWLRGFEILERLDPTKADELRRRTRSPAVFDGRWRIPPG